MKVTYQRPVDHCSVSPYVKMITIKTVNPAVNSDHLDTVTFNESGRFALVKRGQFKVGDSVLFIPAETVLPLELSNKLGVTNYLTKGRVRVAKLRGNRSEGLVVEKEMVEPYLPYLMKWEDPPTVHMKGNPMKRDDVPLEFEKFYRMSNLLDEPNLFSENECIFVSEKIHGTNCRFGYLQNPNTKKFELYVGSHNVVLKESDNNVYWKTVKKVVSSRLVEAPGIVFYGEIYGPGIQHLHYDLDIPTLKVFAATRRYDYMNVLELKDHCDRLCLPIVRHHKTTFTDLETLRTWADSPSEVALTHMREGIVVVSCDRPDVMAKVIGFDYLTKKKRTERK